MPESSIATSTMPLPDVKNRLASLVQAVSRQESRILIEEAGAPVAALVSITDFDRLTRLDSESAARRQALEAIGAAFADVPLEELEAQITRIMTEGPQVDGAEPRRKLA